MTNPDDDYTPPVVLSTEKAAEYLGYRPGTLTSWRQRKQGPRYLKIGKRIVRYYKSDLDAWLRAKECAND